MGNRFKKWIVFAGGITLGTLIAYYATNFISYAQHAKYDRRGLENQMMLRFGNKTFNDIVIDELIINAYEYNSNQPRFYSKYFRDVKKGTHDVLLREAMGGSAAAPMFFDP